jgi:chorismate mutase
MADYQLGDNSYANQLGQYYSFDNKHKRQYSQSPFGTQSAQINDVYNKQRKSQLDLLKQQRTKAISGFNQQKKDLVPQYAAQRNQSDVVNAQNVSRLREVMAANGINASGENVTASADLASSRQGALNNINTQQNQANAAIDKQIADVNDPAQEQAIINGIETERSRGISDAFNQSMQQIYQQNQNYLQQQWQKYVFNNISASEKAGFGMNKYGIDAGNAANSAASAAELAYYKNGGFLTP